METTINLAAASAAACRRLERKWRLGGTSGNDPPEKPSEPILNGLHLVDLALLGLDDLAAQRDQFWVAQLGLAAHQDRAGVVGDHSANEFLVADRRLRAHDLEAAREDDQRGQPKGEIEAIVRIHLAHENQHEDGH